LSLLHESFEQDGVAIYCARVDACYAGLGVAGKDVGRLGTEFIEGGEDLDLVGAVGGAVAFPVGVGGGVA
jgi:hypothetical protein